MMTDTVTTNEPMVTASELPEDEIEARRWP